MAAAAAAAAQVRHGNEDTFREMLRIKRSVTAAFSNMHFNMAVIELPSNVGELEAGSSAPRGAVDPMAGLEAEAAAAQPTGNGLSAGLSKFVSAGTTGGTLGTEAQANAEEIDLGDEEEEGADAEEEDVELETKAVPQDVFAGTNKRKAGGDAAEEEQEGGSVNKAGRFAGAGS